jgi:protease-4
MIRLVLVLIRNSVHLLSYLLQWPFFALGRALQRGPIWVTVPLKEAFPIAGAGGLSRWFQDTPTFLQMRQNFKTLAEAGHVEGVILELDHWAMGPAQQVEVIEWIENLKAGQKRVVIHADQLSTSDFAMAAHANDILIPPSGRLYTFKPRAELLFAHRVLRRFGVQPQFIHIGAFKTAMHRFIRASSTTAQRNMTVGLVEGLSRHILSRVQKQRKMTPEAAQRLFEDAPIAAGRANAVGLVDAQVFRDDVAAYLRQGRDFSQSAEVSDVRQPLDFDAFLSSQLRLKWLPFRRPKTLALVDLSGMIVTPDVSLPTSGAVIDSGVVVPILRSLADNPRVGGVILHIDSPGGSALASDLIWRAVQDVRRQKPVVAWCSNVVASGGYYIAVAANEIVCRPETIIGSIGVITGKLSLGEAAEHNGVDVESTGDDTNAMMSMFAPLSGRGLENLKADTRAFYARFLQRVGQARKIEPRRLHRYARGRVYLGDQAIERNLADHLGGFETSLDRVCSLAGLDKNKVKIVTYSHRKTSLKDALRSSILQAPGASALAEGADVWALFKSGQVLAWMPQRITWR